MNIFNLLQKLADWLTYQILGITQNSLLGNSINFFVFDTLKIFILLTVIIYIISLIRTYLPPTKIKKILSHRNKYIGNILASFLGIITPFCTCSAIPLFLGFIEAGVPLSVTFSFLIASPMINEIALVMLLGLFGFRIALIYIISGLVIAILSGVIIGKLNVESLIEKFVLNEKQSTKNDKNMVWRERTDYAQKYTINIIKRVWLYVIVGIGIGAWIHGYVPVDFITKYVGNGHWYNVPLVTILGIPLYSSAAGIIPLVQVLTEKGIQIGTALAFMMAVTGLSLPEFLILKRVMKTKLIIIFASIVGLGIIFTGYLFNWLIN